VSSNQTPKLEIVRANQLENGRWDDFCRKSEGAWFWHSESWRDYTLAYRPDLESRSLAFAAVAGDEVVGINPLMIEEREGAGGRYRELSFGGDSCWAPAIAGVRASRMAAWRLVLDEVDAIAAAEGAARVSLRLSPLVPGFSDQAIEMLAATTRQGYLDVSLSTQVIDLEQPAEELRRQMSKGHRADITRGLRTMTWEAVDSGNLTPDAFSEYQQMHALAAGRVTRPAVTFEMMRDWIGRGWGALLRACAGTRAVGFTYLLLFGDGAYYASAANDPDFAREPVGHVLQAAAIEWLKGRGFRRYEVGVQQFGPLPHNLASEKDVNISRFKRGFGGTLMPLLVREKFYDPAMAKDVLAARVAAYAAAVASPAREVQA
jgi:hypothetical protein